MKVKFKQFTRLLGGNFEDAADFASQLPPDRLVSISTLPANISIFAAGGGFVVVWYWADDNDATTTET